MPSDITSENFPDIGISSSVCDAFQQKLLNNSAIRTLLDYLFDSATGGFAEAFARDLSAFLGPVGKIVFTANILNDSERAPETGQLWIPCDGSKYIKTEYPALSAHCGAYFNALTDRADVVLETEFRVPDLRGRVLVAHEGGFSVRERGGSKAAKLTIPDHVHAIGRYQTATGDQRNDLVLYPTAQASFNNNTIKNKDGRRAQVDHNNVGTMQGAGDMIVSTTQTKEDGTAVDQIEQQMPPFQVGMYYILAGFRLRGTLL